MSQYQNRWAACVHGKRNRRVCYDCLNAAKLGKIFDDGVKRLVDERIANRHKMDIASEIIPKTELTEEEKKAWAQLAIDRRDHEGAPRSHPNREPALIAFDKYPWRKRG